LNTLQAPPHHQYTHKTGPKSCTDLSWHALSPGYRAKLIITLKNKDLTTCGIQKKFDTHTLEPVEAGPVLGRSAYPLQN